MPRFDNGAVYTKLQKGDIVLMGDPSVYGEILAENFFVEDITRVNLQALITASELVNGKFYRITNAVGGTLSLLVQAVSSNLLGEYAVSTTTGETYKYDITADTAILEPNPIALGTANQLLGVNAGATEQEYKTLSGQADRINISVAPNSIEIQIEDDLSLNSIQLDAGAVFPNDVPKYSQVRKDTTTHKINLSEFDNETLQALTGGSVAVVGLNAVGNEELQEEAVTPDKTRDYIASLNLQTSPIEQGTINDSTGANVTSANFIRTSQFVDIEPSTQYTLSDNKGYQYRVFQYDSTQAYIGFINNATTFTTGGTTQYIKIATYASTSHSDLTTLLMLNVGATALTYVSPAPKMTFDFIEQSEALKILRNCVVGYNKNSSTIESGTINSSGVPVTGSFVRTKDFIAVTPNTQYTVSDDKGYLYRFYEYTSAKVFIVRTAATTITTGANTYFLKLATYSSTTHNDTSVKIMLSEGDIALPYEEYGLRIPEEFIQPSEFTETQTKFLGKNFVTFGDSITWYDGKPFGSTHIEFGEIAVGYQSYMRESLGLNVVNQGYSGRTMPELWNDVIDTYPFTNVDFVSITIGANDHRENVQPGVVLPIGSTFDTTTTAGALQASIEKILNDDPLIRIYLMTPIRGWYNESGTIDVPGPYNGEEQLSEEYAIIIKEVAKVYALPVLDWYNLTMINEITRPVYIGDEESAPYYLHPTQLGFRVMANTLIPFLINN